MEAAETLGKLVGTGILVLMLFWLFSGILSGWIAWTKRREVVGHFLLGTLFGPLWLLVLAALGPAGRPCPACRERIDRRATVCPHCQRELAPRRVAKSPPRETDAA